MRVKGFAPRGARVREQDVHAVRVLLDAVEELLDALNGGAVGGDGDGLGSWGEVGEFVEQGHGGVACCGFAGGDEDFGAARLEEAIVFGR